jgi:hypothetical protein
VAPVIQQNPVIIDIRPQEESELSQLSDVLIGTLGIAGVLMLLALVFGAAIAGVMFWLRSRN